VLTRESPGGGSRIYHHTLRSLLQIPNKQVAIRVAALQVIQQDPQMNELESLLGFFASFVLDTEVVTQILRWDMAVLRESPWYQEILQQGAQRERSLVLRQLTRRLGSLSPALQTQVMALPLEKLENLGEALLDFQGTIDLVDWLESHLV
jgi:predicted transposase YdaD